MSEKTSNGPYRATKLWNDTVRAFYNGMPLSRHWRGLKQYENCFAAHEAVRWLTDYLASNPNFGSNISKEQTVKLLRKFLKCGLIIGARGNRIYADDFQDNRELYKFSHQSPLKSLRTPRRIPLVSIATNIPEHVDASPKLQKYTPKKSPNFSNAVDEKNKKLSQNENMYNERRAECLKPSANTKLANVFSEKEIDLAWKEIVQLRFQKISKKFDQEFGLNLQLNPDSIDTCIIRQNMSLLPIHTKQFAIDQLPAWIFSAMKSLVNWPNQSKSVCNIPNYSGVELDIFKVVRDYFSNPINSWIPNELHETVLKFYTKAEKYDENQRNLKDKRSKNYSDLSFHSSNISVTPRGPSRTSSYDDLIDKDEANSALKKLHEVGNKKIGPEFQSKYREIKGRIDDPCDNYKEIKVLTEFQEKYSILDNRTESRISSYSAINQVDNRASSRASFESRAISRASTSEDLTSISTDDSIEDLMLNMSICASRPALQENDLDENMMNFCSTSQPPLQNKNKLSIHQNLNNYDEYKKEMNKTPLLPIEKRCASIPRSLKLNKLENYTNFKDSYLYDPEKCSPAWSKTDFETKISEHSHTRLGKDNYSPLNSKENLDGVFTPTPSNRVTLKSIKNKSKNSSQKYKIENTNNCQCSSESKFYCGCSKILKSSELENYSLPPNACFETAFTSDSPITRIVPQKSVDTIHLRHFKIRPKSIAISSFGDLKGEPSCNELKFTESTHSLGSMKYFFAGNTDDEIKQVSHARSRSMVNMTDLKANKSKHGMHNDECFMNKNKQFLNENEDFINKNEHSTYRKDCSIDKNKHFTNENKHFMNNNFSKNNSNTKNYIKQNYEDISLYSGKSMHDKLNSHSFISRSGANLQTAPLLLKKAEITSPSSVQVQTNEFPKPQSTISSLAAKVRDSIKRKKSKDMNRKCSKSSFIVSNQNNALATHSFRGSYNLFKRRTSYSPVQSECSVDSSVERESLLNVKRLKTKVESNPKPVLLQDSNKLTIGKNLIPLIHQNSNKIYKIYSSNETKPMEIDVKSVVEENRTKNDSISPYSDYCSMKLSDQPSGPSSRCPSSFYNSEMSTENSPADFLDCKSSDRKIGSAFKFEETGPKISSHRSTASTPSAYFSENEKKSENKHLFAAKCTTPNGCLTHVMNSFNSSFSNSLYLSALSGLNNNLSLDFSSASNSSLSPKNNSSSSGGTSSAFPSSYNTANTFPTLPSTNTSLPPSSSTNSNTSLAHSVSPNVFLPNSTSTKSAENSSSGSLPASTSIYQPMDAFRNRKSTSNVLRADNLNISKRSDVSLLPELPKRAPVVVLQNDTTITSNGEYANISFVSENLPGGKNYATSTSFTRDFLRQSKSVQGLLSKDSKEGCIEGLQLIFLLIEPTRRRKLYLLLKMMSRCSSNDKLKLHQLFTNREVMLKTFTRSIIQSENENDRNVTQILTNLVSFLIDNHAHIFQLPQNLPVLVHRRLNNPVLHLNQKTSSSLAADEGKLPVSYCYRVSPNTYKHQKLSNSQKFLSELLDQLIENPKLNDKQKRKKVKQFKEHYPEIFHMKFTPGSTDQENIRHILNYTEKKSGFKAFKKLASLKNLRRLR